MDTPTRPSLRDWIVARHAAGLPVVSATPRKARSGLNIRAHDDAVNGGKPPHGSSTDRLSIASDDAQQAGDLAPVRRHPPATSVEAAPGPRAKHSRLNIRGAEDAGNGGKPPCGNSTDRLSIADGFALLDAGRDQLLDSYFAALADPTRRAMLEMLARGERTVGALAAPHAMSLAAAARHVAVLDRAGLVIRRRIGRRHLCRLRPDALRDVGTWLNRFAGIARDRLPPVPHPLNPGARQGSDDT